MELAFLSQFSVNRLLAQKCHLRELDRWLCIGRAFDLPLQLVPEEWCTGRGLLAVENSKAWCKVANLCLMVKMMAICLRY